MTQGQVFTVTGEPLDQRDVSFSMDLVSADDAKLLQPAHMASAHQRKHSKTLQNHPVVIFAGFPGSGVEYLEHLIHATKLTTHSLNNNENTDFAEKFEALNTMSLTEDTSLTEEETKIALEQPSGNQPFVVKTNYPAAVGKLLSVPYTKILFVIRNPIDNLVELTKMKHKVRLLLLLFFSFNPQITSFFVFLSPGLEVGHDDGSHPGLHGGLSGLQSLLGIQMRPCQVPESPLRGSRAC